MEIIKIKDVKPAAYNPRVIDNESLATLKKSFDELGCIKPIIVNTKNMTIVAGHQRTKTMLSLGIEECPAFLINGIDIQDEIRFNQFHNKCEYEVNDDAPKVRIKCSLHEGINRVSHKDIEVLDKGKLSVLNSLICKLMMKYGEFGAPVANYETGDVIISSAYAMASKTLSTDMYVFGLDSNKSKIALSYFSRDYGHFNYDSLKKQTYAQGFAQMKRLRDGKKGSGNSMQSSLYKQRILPYLATQDKSKIRIIDFGAGQMDYVKKLRGMGYNIIGVEPYHFKQGSQVIDFSGNVERYRKVCDDLIRFGRYDVVVCDSVLNSVDSVKAEESVIMTCKALCKIGGKIFISGRPLEFEEQRENLANSIKVRDSYVNFLDSNNFTAIYRQGRWFYQKFHSEEQRTAVLNRLGEGEIFDAKNSSHFHICVTKTNESDIKEYIEALKFEWDMILPNGKRYGLQDEIENAYVNRKPDY